MRAPETPQPSLQAVLTTLRSWWMAYLDLTGSGPVADEHQWQQRRSLWWGHTPDGEMSYLYRRRKRPDGSWEIEYLPAPDHGDGFRP
jgi:hypothetical protein